MAPGQASITTEETAMPGVLVEMLSLTSPADWPILASGEGRQAMAIGVARGIERYLRI